jgi:signal transduction histidine kinase
MPNQRDTSGRVRRGAAARAEAVRAAVDQAFQAGAAHGAAAAGQGRERATDLIAQAAGRVRDVLDELRPATYDDLRDLRERVAALEARVAALEAAAEGAGGPSGGGAAER